MDDLEVPPFMETPIFLLLLIGALHPADLRPPADAETETKDTKAGTLQAESGETDIYRNHTKATGKHWENTLCFLMFPANFLFDQSYAQLTPGLVGGH